MSNFALFIARRYFLQGRINFINIISMLSIMVVTVVTASLVIVLSVFNGMEDLIRHLFDSFDPQLKIESTLGKSFPVNAKLLQSIRATDGVWHLTEVIEDNAMVAYKEQTDVIRLKGMSNDFLLDHRMDSAIIEGHLILEDSLRYFAVLGAGVQYKLSVSLQNQFAPLTIYYPNRKKLRTASFDQHMNSGSIMPAGVFAIEKQYDDNYLLTSIGFAEEVLGYEGTRTALEVSVVKGTSVESVKKSLQKLLGENFRILNTDEQHSALIKALKIEKLAVSVILSSVLAVASVGIYFCLSVLVLRKRKDMGILKALGASQALIKRIFYLEGQLIAVSGALIGLTLGFVICFLQKLYGYVKMGMTTSVVDAYPVKIEALDFVAIFGVVIFLTLLASVRPALDASRASNKG